MTHERWEKMIEWAGRKSVKYRHIRMQVDATAVRMIDDTVEWDVCVCVRVWACISTHVVCALTFELAYHILMVFHGFQQDLLWRVHFPAPLHSNRVSVVSARTHRGDERGQLWSTRPQTPAHASRPRLAYLCPQWGALETIQLASTSNALSWTFQLTADHQKGKVDSRLAVCTLSFTTILCQIITRIYKERPAKVGVGAQGKA